jgi:DNA-binding beta-propeller fold protein YncE
MGSISGSSVSRARWWAGLAMATALLIAVIVAPVGWSAVAHSSDLCGARPVAGPGSWRPARRKLVPPGAERMKLCTVRSSLGVDPLATRQLTAEFDAIAVGSASKPPCAAGTKPGVVARFAYKSGHVVDVSVQLGSCALVSNGRLAGLATGRHAQLLMDLQSLLGTYQLSPRLVASRGAPGCSLAVSRPPPSAGQPTTVAMGGAPSGVASDPGKPWSFVAETDTASTTSLPRAGSVAVVSDSAPLPPRQVRIIGASSQPVNGAVVTRDGKYLLVASQSGAIVIDARRAEAGAGRAVLGELAVTDQLALGAIEVAATSDDRYVFVSEEYSNAIAVFDLRAALRDHFRASALVDTITLGQAVVGLALSPDATRLYATSEAGSLSVISVARATLGSADPVLANVTAGCAPVRVAVSGDGKTVWVTARGSNALLGFSTRELTTHPSLALRADVRVGEAPVGLALINHGQQIVVADSNRFDASGAQSGITIINARAAINHQPAITGEIPTGLFARDVSLSSNGILLVSDYGSDQITAVPATSLL